MWNRAAQLELLRLEKDQRHQLKRSCDSFVKAPRKKNRDDSGTPRVECTSPNALMITGPAFLVAVQDWCTCYFLAITSWLQPTCTPRGVTVTGAHPQEI